MTWGVRDVRVRFGERVALDRVSLEALPGQVTGVVGGDGAGKTTLLRALVGALRADGGEVVRPEAERIGYLASSSGIYPDLTVDENLVFAAVVYGIPRNEIDARAGEYLERAGLGSARARLAGNLSGGMRQKLGVIRSMIHRPDLLVLDEPTTGVDPVSRADLWWLIARATAEGAAVVLSTAYLDEAERASSLLVLHEGRALASGTAAEIQAAVPGELQFAPRRPSGDAAARAWRRGRTWRVWSPPEVATPAEGRRIEPDLQDAVTMAALSVELHVPDAAGPRR